MKIIKIIRDGAEPRNEKGGPGGARAQDRVDRSGENASVARARIAEALDKIITLLLMILLFNLF